MMTNQQTPPNRDSQPSPLVGNVSTKTQNVSTNEVHTQDCRICVGDFVRYIGENQSLRVQCEDSLRDGVRVTAIEGEVAFILSPQWFCDYRVPVGELVVERRGNVPQLQSSPIDRHNPSKTPPGEGWLWLPDKALPGGGKWAHKFEVEIWHPREEASNG